MITHNMFGQWCQQIEIWQINNTLSCLDPLDEQKVYKNLVFPTCFYTAFCTQNDKDFRIFS